MEWTTESPTKTGWYWYKDCSSSRIVLLWKSYDEGLRCEPAISSTDRVSGITGKWAGPIPVPKDKK